MSFVWADDRSQSSTHSLPPSLASTPLAISRLPDDPANPAYEYYLCNYALLPILPLLSSLILPRAFFPFLGKAALTVFICFPNPAASLLPAMLFLLAGSPLSSGSLSPLVMMLL